MKNLFIKCFLILCCSLFGHVAFSQCSVQTEKDEGFTYYTSSPEPLTDIENTVRFNDGGGLQISLGTTMLVKNDKSNSILSLDLYIGKIRTTSLFAPRKIMLYLDTDSVISLESYTYRIMESNNKTSITKYSYILTPNALPKLMNRNISRICFVDNRLNQRENFTPFKDVLRTQLNCIAKSLRSSN